ncbi:putative type VI secretion system effector [Quatrionicoccus australiensis]|uniref:putative type VI secretion system effector n=1 Tax=Quatrionicoccus australiensis TaxID=138118 RepID=UPI001CFA8CC4|nr:putative type VI secretion system effector [Quatrionicoccus australiensis]MCB4359493.1 hypothetical protein [Quatrionicoccus australiensis]
MTDFLPHPNAEGLVKLSGTIRNLKVTRNRACFVFTESDQTKMGVIAIASAMVDMGGQAMSTAANASAMEEEADFLEFELDGKPVKGWVWWNPFKEGDEVEVAVEWRGEHYEFCAVARPEDKIVALYPHCSRGSASHWRNAWKWWISGTSLALFFCGGLMEIWGRFIYDWSPFFNEKMGSIMVLGFVGFFYPVFALMTCSLARKWMPFVRLSEKVFRAFGWEKPASVDLVKRSKEGRKGDEKPEYGVFYFRY